VSWDTVGGEGGEGGMMTSNGMVIGDSSSLDRVTVNWPGREVFSSETCLFDGWNGLFSNLEETISISFRYPNL
jgi:hypothetical protein